METFFVLTPTLLLICILISCIMRILTYIINEKSKLEYAYTGNEPEVSVPNNSVSLNEDEKGELYGYLADILKAQDHKDKHT